MKKLIYLLFCIVAGIGMVSAQVSRVTGKVTSADDGEPVIGASVLVKGTSTGVITDADGSFTLVNLPSNARTLVVSYVGMVTQEVAVRPTVDVRLATDNQNLEEVIVVGYGTQRKKDVTSAISKVGGSDIANLAAPSFDTQIAGRAAGVQVITQSGILGSAPEFRIRGTSTITSGAGPLIVVDGVPVTSGEKQELYGRSNPMADINPNDIESIDILKDGAATAIYGSRAANGVVLVTTKRGVKGSARVTYDGYIASTSPLKTFDLLNAKEFVEIANEKYSNWGMEGPAVYDPNGPDTNWNSHIYQTGFQQNHSLSASGGTDKGNYYASVGYTNMEGIVRKNQQERYTMSANVTQTANKWLQVGAGLIASRNRIEGIMNQENSLGSVGFASVRMLPNVDVFNPDDKTGYNIDAANRKALGRGINKTYIDNGIQNIVWALDNNRNTTRNTRLAGNVFAEIKFMEGLTLRSQGGMDFMYAYDFTKWDAESGDGYGYGGLLMDQSTQYFNWNWQNVLNFVRSFGPNNVNLTLVQEYTHEDYEYTYAQVTQLSDNFFSNHIISNTFGEKSVSGSKTFNGLASYMARANYNYDSKYYAGASIRRDGLSRLPKDTRWGTFFGGSAAYRLSRESFWAESTIAEWFSDLRLRASFATIGNSDLGSNFPYLGTYGAKGYGAQKGIGWTNMGNDRLKWETTTTYDLGLDGSLFNGRLGFEFAYYMKKTKDLVLEVPTAPTIGIPGNSYYDNVGQIQNSGIELSINATPVANREGLTWQTSVNFTTQANKVIKLTDGNDIVNVFTITREGESIHSIYGYDYYGVNKANGNPIWTKADGTLVQFSTFGDGAKGEIEYDYAVYDPANPSDVSKQGSLSASDDRKVLGTSLPKWYGGFNNTFAWKGLDLNIFMRFSGGNKIMNATRQRTLLNLDFSNNGKEILGRWQSADKPGDGMTPRIGYGDDNPLFNTSVADSHFVEDGSFLKLSNLALGYTLPTALSSKIDVAKIRLYVQAQNLLTITGYTGMDPETRSYTGTTVRSGVDWDGMPQARTIMIGANISF
jgi:TonB-linked SusC/RagA family outer membrane protein